MAHYAFLDEKKIVTEVIPGRNENEVVQNITDWESHYAEFRGQSCKRTSYNTYGGIHYTTDDDGNRIPSDDQTKAFRKNYAGIGYTYDEARDAFIPPKPFESWVLNEDTCLWDAPVPMPEDDNVYTWDEESTSWTLVE